MGAVRRDQPGIHDFAELSGNVLRDGRVRPHPIDVKSGLECIPAVLNELRLKRVSGKKIVVTTTV